MDVNEAAESNISEKIKQATNELLRDPDWGANLEICDAVNKYPPISVKVVETLKKRIAHKDPHIGVLAVNLLDNLVKNCASFHGYIANKDFMKVLVKATEESKGLFKRKLDNESNIQKIELKEKILVLIQTWAQTFRQSFQYPIFDQTYQELRRQNVLFPQPHKDETAPVFTPPVKVPRDSAPPTQPKPASKVDAELQAASESANVLIDMLTASTPTENLRQNDLIQTLVQNCRAAQARGMMRASDANERNLEQVLLVNDVLLDAIQYYDGLVSGTTQRRKPKPVEKVEENKNKNNSSSNNSNNNNNKNSNSSNNDRSRSEEKVRSSSNAQKTMDLFSDFASPATTVTNTKTTTTSTKSTTPIASTSKPASKRSDANDNDIASNNNNSSSSSSSKNKNTTSHAASTSPLTKQPAGNMAAIPRLVPPDEAKKKKTRKKSSNADLHAASLEGEGDEGAHVSPQVKSKVAAPTSNPGSPDVLDLFGLSLSDKPATNTMNSNNNSNRQQQQQQQQQPKTNKPINPFDDSFDPIDLSVRPVSNNNNNNNNNNNSNNADEDDPFLALATRDMSGSAPNPARQSSTDEFDEFDMLAKR